MQAIHAAVEASRRFLPADTEHPHLVLCGLADEERLLAAADHLFLHNIRFALFREPDRGNEATALATEPLRGARRRPLHRFRCLRREAPSVAPVSEPARRSAAPEQP